jgi:HPt (histidine-containing phosphotransfer) domain-containing protein
MRGAPTPDELRLLDPDGEFQQRLMADRDTIERLAAAGPPAELARVVHGLAGAAGTFGHKAIGDAAMALDDALRDGDGPSIPALLAALRDALRQV